MTITVQDALATQESLQLATTLQDLEIALALDRRAPVSKGLHVHQNKSLLWDVDLLPPRLCRRSRLEMSEVLPLYSLWSLREYRT